MRASARNKYGGGILGREHLPKQRSRTTRSQSLGRSGRRGWRSCWRPARRRTGWHLAPGCRGIRLRLPQFRDKDGQTARGHERSSVLLGLRLRWPPWGWVGPGPGCWACPRPWSMAPWPSSSLSCTTCSCFTTWTPLSQCTRSTKLPSGSESLCEEEELLLGGEETGSITLGQYLRQLARHRNFLWFVGMDLVQVFHCHFNSNFFPLFLEHLLSDHISLSTGSFLLGISYVAPHLNNLYFLPLCRRWGVYAVVRGLFLLKLGLSLLMLCAGPDRPGLLCLFIARYALPSFVPTPLSHPFIFVCSLSAGSNRVFTEGTCKLLTLVVTDLVDEDLVLNHRKQAASALLFGMVALVTKPGQTFAPLLGTWLLCFYTGHDLFQQPALTPVGSAQPWPEPPAPPPPQAPTLRQGCFYLLVLVPLTCALLQLFTWSQFTLYGRRLHAVKAQRQNLSRAQTLDIKMV
ncbi:transmembrane protein 180 isoform X4 [Orcinus orca]|uniref:transmembrane protein 180 isoform X4 n=1 Tax=Orcinus orca TaxID=9733 RepID=UPI001441D418|nr:transmembrane protein 180 isoform X4 [Orcinus orca]XP_049552791.1 transmembrane protein 180 isoform X4 [Orcinus orca]